MAYWPRPLKKPRKLNVGDRVAVVTPCWGGPACLPHRFEAGTRYLAEEFGLEVVLMPHACKPVDWLDRNPEARADDVMDAFADRSVSAVIASIGGDDCIRLLPYLDLDLIAENPKVLLGYSDVTVLHFACLKAGVTSIYGPTVMAGFAENGGMHAFTKDAIRQVLFSSEPPGKLPRNTEGWTDERLSWAVPGNQSRKRRLHPAAAPRLWQGSGRSRGPLIGGCAEVLEMTKGTELWPPLDIWSGAILFYETSEEAPAPSTVARWLRNFGAQGILGVLAGVIVGRPGGGVPSDRQDDYGAAMAKVLTEYGAERLPLVTGLDFGHTDPMTLLPYGVAAEIDCDDVSISLLEAAVGDAEGKPAGASG
ncbi:MAG: LD-carboxypeptidase [Roseicyclus sp.]|nr:LD-carboxypeptidase [Roseicyclus sp.]MBO6625113.1 LD-carboxypeptidase [Roseicyclus sp.]